MRYIPMDLVRRLASSKCAMKVVLSDHFVREHEDAVAAQLRRMQEEVMTTWRAKAAEITGLEMTGDGVTMMVETVESFQVDTTAAVVSARWDPYEIRTVICMDGPADGRRMDVPQVDGVLNYSPPRMEVQVQDRVAHGEGTPDNTFRMDVVGARTVGYSAAGWDAESSAWILTPDGRPPRGVYVKGSVEIQESICSVCAGPIRKVGDHGWHHTARARAAAGYVHHPAMKWPG